MVKLLKEVKPMPEEGKEEEGEEEEEEEW